MFLVSVDPVFNLLKNISLSTVLLYICVKTVDFLLSRWIGEKVIDKQINKTKNLISAYLTKYKQIEAEMNFSLYLAPDIRLDEAVEKVESGLTASEQFSAGMISVKEPQWDQNSAEIEIGYDNGDSYTMVIKLVQDTEDVVRDSSTTLSEPVISSIGINLKFEFEFHDLKGALIDVNAISGFIRQGFTDEFRIRNSTANQIVVGSLNNDLTLDDWIEEEQFDVSLLLKSEDEKRSVEFRGNSAIIVSPHTEIDDETAEYIRATLMNYYL